jgi:hypothetical protein
MEWQHLTGSGKTVAAKLLIARTILLAPPELQPVQVTVIDPKSDFDFNFLDGLPRFFRGEEAPQGLNDIYNAFRNRQKKIDMSRNLKIAFIDEFASLINLIDERKEKETTQRQLNLLLSLSRSFRFSIQMATQQPSAQVFGVAGSSSREQFGTVCLLGDNEGTECQKMLFGSDSRERIRKYGSVGKRCGWITLNGGIAQPVRVPNIEIFDKLHAIIKSGVER